MKTKFSDLLKLKDRKIKEIERALSIKIDELRSAKVKQEDIVNKINEFQTDKSGEIGVYQVQKSYFNLLIDKKDEILSNINRIESKIETLRTEYKEASIEYEKILYLHKEDKKLILDEIKSKESKMMDEVANILFNKKSHKESL